MLILDWVFFKGKDCDLGFLMLDIMVGVFLEVVCYLNWLC